MVLEKYCVNCGAELDEDVKFCPKCGAKQPENTKKGDDTKKSSDSKDIDELKNNITSSIGNVSDSNAETSFGDNSDNKESDRGPANGQDINIHSKTIDLPDENNYGITSGPYNGSGAPGIWNTYSKTRDRDVFHLSQCMGLADYVYYTIDLIFTIFICNKISNIMEDEILDFILGVLVLITLVEILCISIQRVHDTGHEGWKFIYIFSPTDWSCKVWPRYDYSKMK